MGAHPIRCGFMFPLRIALTLGQVAHATLGQTLRRRWGLWPFWAKRPKIVSPYHKRDRPRAFAWMQTEALLPFCVKGCGSKR